MINVIQCNVNVNVRKIISNDSWFCLKVKIFFPLFPQKINWICKSILGIIRASNCFSHSLSSLCCSNGLRPLDSLVSDLVLFYDDDGQRYLLFYYNRFELNSTHKSVLNWCEWMAINNPNTQIFYSPKNILSKLKSVPILNANNHI